MRKAATAVGAVLLLWQLRAAVPVNIGNIALMHTVMAQAAPRLAASYTPPPRVDGDGVGRAAQAFSLARQDRLALRGMAQALLWKHQYRAAATMIDDALDVGGGGRERMLAGEAHLRAGDRDRGIAEWTAASRDGMLLPLATQLLQEVAEGGPVEARARVRDVVGVLRVALVQRGLSDHQRRPVIRTIARAYEAIDDLRSAESVLQPLVAGAQPDPDALAMLAAIAYRNHRRPDAERYARLAIAHDPQLARWAPHSLLGQMALERCDLAAAARHLRDGLRAPYDGDYRYYSQHWLLAVVEYERGNAAAAAAEWRIYLDERPDDDDVRERIAQASARKLPRRCAGGGSRL